MCCVGRRLPAFVQAASSASRVGKVRRIDPRNASTPTRKTQRAGFSKMNSVHPRTCSAQRLIPGLFAADDGPPRELLFEAHRGVSGLVDGSASQRIACKGSGNPGSTNRRYRSAAFAAVEADQTDLLVRPEDVAKSLATTVAWRIDASRLPGAWARRKHPTARYDVPSVPAADQHRRSGEAPTSAP